MKPVSRIQISHEQYQGPRLHNDLNKLVTESNDNFSSQQSLIDKQQKIIATHTDTIANLLGRIAKLEAGGA
jgi:hypothetical protein